MGEDHLFDIINAHLHFDHCGCTENHLRAVTTYDMHTENLAVFVWERLAASVGERMRLERVRVYESPDLFVDYFGPDM